MYDKCRACHGTKKAEYMGGMMRECEACNGLGYSAPKVEEKKAGRPKKDKGVE